jgi:collagen type VII alpha
MFSAIRRRMTWANVAMTLALVFAMSGGAYAAKKYLITSTKQISPKVLAQLKGAKGPAGERGPAGEKGANGTNGAPGTPGKNGENGAPGTNGKDGVSVTSAEVSKSSTTCSKLGGSEFTASNGKTTACNGKEGSPWTAGGTLPTGQSEHGNWAVATTPITVSGTSLTETAISFNIKLPSPVTETNVHVIAPGTPEGSDPTGCTGTIANPGAVSGNLCLFVAEEENVAGYLAINWETTEIGAGKSGATLEIPHSGTKPNLISTGVWVVTA